MKFILTCAFFFTLLLIFSCGPATPQKEKKIASRDTTISATNSYSQLFFDSTHLETFIGSQHIHDSMAVRLRDFYNQRNYQYAWFFKEGIAEYANTFITQQNDYMGYAQDSSIFNPVLNALLDTIAVDSTKVPDSIRLKTELLLTRQFILYASRAYTGNRDINTKELGWFIPRRKINVVQVLDSMLANRARNSKINEPVNRQYGLLKEHLVKYYAIEKDGGWKLIKADKKSYKPGDNSPAISEIKIRLWQTGDLKEKDTSGLFTPELTEAVKNYQSRYGFKDNGIVNASLIAEMNKPVSDRIRQILINMERLRWVPAEPAGDYLLVNLPEFRLHVYEQGEYKWNMNVVVGSAAHNSVIFTGDMKFVVFSPYWNVPPGILKSEVLPGIKRNKNYLASHNMEWNGGAVRQKPGPRNSLGLVKFLFPNSYNIYLHDTPAKSLFDEDVRAFSHGCIRLAEPKKLAEYLLRNDSSWNTARITKAMNSGKETFVTLKKQIPVFIVYFTSWVDRDGRLNFRDDIYGHDKKMAERLFK